MADVSTQSIVIEAPPDRVIAVICDFSRYPEWVSSVRAAEVVEEYEDGYASQVRFELDAGVFVDEYILRYEYTDDLHQIEWDLAEPSRVQRAQHGWYDIVPSEDGGGSQVTYSLSVELGISMIGMVKRKAERVIMDTALRDLKARVEALTSDEAPDRG